MKVSDNSLTAIVCCHKACELPSRQYLLPVQAGSALHDSDFGIQRDDLLFGKPCDNISEKNTSFCELTAVYWAWKNLRTVKPDTKFVGVCHYRRFFHISNDRFMGDVMVKRAEQISDYAIDFSVLNHCFHRHDIIVPRRLHGQFSVMNSYCLGHISDDIRTLICTIHDLYPECDDAVREALIRSNAFSAYNMFIAPWSLFDEYCHWLFSILFEVERLIDISNYNSVQRRVFGYMGERLLNVWLKWRHIRPQEVPIEFYDGEPQNNAMRKKSRFLYNDLKFNWYRPSQKRSREMLNDITTKRLI